MAGLMLKPGTLRVSLCAAAHWQEPAPGGTGASTGITVLQNRGLFTEEWWPWGSGCFRV